jgi:Uma2 family endonuclease
MSTWRPFRFTREQYYRLGDLGFFRGKRVERIRGEIIEVSPRNWPHVVGCRRAAEALERAFAGIGWISRQEAVSLADSDPEPDVSVMPGRFEDYTDHPTTALLVVEVADTSLSAVITTMAEVYAESGIPEYWVVDLNGRRLLVFRDPQPLPAALGASAYRTHRTLGPGDSISPLAAPQAAVRVGDLLP